MESWPVKWDACEGGVETIMTPDLTLCSNQKFSFVCSIHDELEQKVISW